MTLAKELLERGERQTVVEYLELCKKFWTMRTHQLPQQPVRTGSASSVLPAGRLITLLYPS